MADNLDQQLWKSVHDPQHILHVMVVCFPHIGPVLEAYVRQLEAAVPGSAPPDEASFKAGWDAGYHDGGEHDCRMSAPTAKRAWDRWRGRKTK